MTAPRLSIEGLTAISVRDGARPILRDVSFRVGRGESLKTIAQRRAEAGDVATAAFYAGEALGIAPNPRWAAYCVWLSLRRATRARRPSA